MKRSTRQLLIAALAAIAIFCACAAGVLFHFALNSYCDCTRQDIRGTE